MNQYEVVFKSLKGKQVIMKLWLSKEIVALNLRKVKKIKGKTK